MITVLGSALWDIILRPTKNIVLKDKHLPLGSKIDIKDVFVSLGGGALNASKTFQNLKIPYKSYFKLGNDLIGNSLLKKIKEERINAEIFRLRGNSSFSVIVLSETGERTIFVYRGNCNSFTYQELKKIKPTDYYYLTTGDSEADIFFKFLSKIRARAKLISLNPSQSFLSKKNSYQALKLVDVLFVNEEEAKAQVIKKINPKILVVTLGNKGCRLFFQNHIITSGVFPVFKVVDLTGAGDSFASAFFANLVLSKKIDVESLKKAIIWGSANASSNIQELGAQIGLLKKKDYWEYEKKSSLLKLQVKSKEL